MIDGQSDSSENRGFFKGNARGGYPIVNKSSGGYNQRNQGYRGQFIDDEQRSPSHSDDRSEGGQSSGFNKGNRNRNRGGYDRGYQNPIGGQPQYFNNGPNSTRGRGGKFFDRQGSNNYFQKYEGGWEQNGFYQGYQDQDKRMHQGKPTLQKTQSKPDGKEDHEEEFEGQKWGGIGAQEIDDPDAQAEMRQRRDSEQSYGGAMNPGQRDDFVQDHQPQTDHFEKRGGFKQGYQKYNNYDQYQRSYRHQHQTGQGKYYYNEGEQYNNYYDGNQRYRGFHQMHGNYTVIILSAYLFALGQARHQRPVHLRTQECTPVSDPLQQLPE